MPERAPAGQLPRSVSVLLENDLVDRIKPGDRVSVVGIYAALPKELGNTHQTKAFFKTILQANNITLLGKEAQAPKISADDLQKIKEVAKQPDIYQQIARSLAPSIFGHDFIKKALLLQLLGGVEKNLKNGTHIRGDINIMMIGDPSTAKSQILRFVLGIAPLAVSTSGRGSSGVGLTAAVVNDQETGERRLEAGAMVLADRGIVCIDEFDKMSVEDRVAIHEVMEQQTVTIAKAGIHASLNARCSVLAAANPIYGKYDRKRKPTENIALPDSLLSRFDLLFIVLDNLESEHDRKISNHVLTMHRLMPSTAEVTTNTSHSSLLHLEEEEDGEGNERDIYVNYATTGANWNKPQVRDNEQQLLFSISFIKKYLLYAKTAIKPTLTEDAAACVVDAFEDLRSGEDAKTLPITPRTLETIIRLSAAHAKCHLSHEITRVNVEAALEVLKYALYHDDSSTVPAPNSDKTEDSIPKKRISDQMDIQADEDEKDNHKQKKIYLENILGKLKTEIRDIELPLSKIMEALKSGDGKILFTEPEVQEILQEMEKSGKIDSFDGEKVYL